MIDLRHIRHFLAVATHPTVQAAADAIHITQPALTKSIARFEEELDEKLFDRRGHKLALTELGERLVERGENLMRHVRNLEEEVALWKGVGTGEVTLGVDPAAELGLLPTVLESFVPTYPNVTVTVRSGHVDSLLPRLLRGELHFLIADADRALERDDLEIRDLVAEPLAMAVRPGHPVSEKAKATLTDLRNYPVAGGTSTPRMDQWSIEQARREGTDVMEPELVCDNYEVLVRLAERSDTIIVGPRSVLSTFEKTNRVTVLPLPFDNGPNAKPSLIRSMGRHLSPAAEKFIELCVESAAQLETPKR